MKDSHVSGKQRETDKAHRPMPVHKRAEMYRQLRFVKVFLGLPGLGIFFFGVVILIFSFEGVGSANVGLALGGLALFVPAVLVMLLGAVFISAAGIVHAIEVTN